MSEDKMKDRLASLQALNNLANDIDDYTDAAAKLELDEFEASFGGGLGEGGMPELDGLGGFGEFSGFGSFDELAGFGGSGGFGELGGVPGAGAFGMPDFGGPAMPGMPSGVAAPGGKPRDVAFYEMIIVHGLHGDYELSFNETEEGLEILVKK